MGVFLFFLDYSTVKVYFTKFLHEYLILFTKVLKVKRIFQKKKKKKQSKR